MELSFECVMLDARKLAVLAGRASFCPSAIVGVSRGGWIPARLLSEAMGVKRLLSIGLSYGDSGRTHPLTYQLPDPMPHDEKLLIVEDCVESGASLAHAAAIFRGAGNEVKTASLYAFVTTQHKPDFMVRTLSHVPRFPWETERAHRRKQSPVRAQLVEQIVGQHTTVKLAKRGVR